MQIIVGTMRTSASAMIRVGLTAVFMSVVALAPAAAQTIFKPVAIVNESVITGFDLAQRAQIIAALGRARPTPDLLRAQALEQLVQDKLKLQAGDLVGITPSDQVVDVGIDFFAQQFNLSADDFRSKLNGEGVSNQAIDDLIGADTVWREVVRARFLNRAEPTETRIDEEIALRSNTTAFSYRLRELGLRLTGNPETDEPKRQLLLQIYEDLSAGGDFDAALQQYSESPNRDEGGDIGWVSASALPAELVRDLNSLQPGDVTKPITVQGGASILQLVERRLGGGDNAVSQEQREQVRQRLLAEEINRLADGYLQELRRDALIELR